MTNRKPKIEQLTIEQAASRYALEMQEDSARGWERVAFWSTQKHLTEGETWASFVSEFLNTNPRYLKASKREGVDTVPTEAGRKVKSRMGLNLKPIILYGDAMLSKPVQVALDESGDALTQPAYSIINRLAMAATLSKHTGDARLTKPQAIAFFVETIAGWHSAPSTAPAKNHQGEKAMQKKATTATKSVTVKDARDFAAAAVMAFMGKLPDDAKHKATRAMLDKYAKGISAIEC